MGAYNFDTLLEESTKLHGHLCPGQVIGVRMAMLGLSAVAIDDPTGKDKKNLVVYVEMDRCATDAVQSVTGCSLGKRTLKFMDYGKMAATFVNISTGRAVRVVAREEARDIARGLYPQMDDKYAAQLEAYKIMSDEALFEVAEVSVEIRPEDMPGRPLCRVQCSLCGEYIQDMREIRRADKVFCRSCADGSYYSVKHTTAKGGFFINSAMQKSHNGMEIRSKLWFEINGEPVFGKGRSFLLEAIDRCGSINQAAKEIDISYRKAWSYIKTMEERLCMKLVERRSGGKNGGGAVLTDDARIFLKQFEQMEQGVKELVDQRFKDLFGDKK